MKNIFDVDVNVTVREYNSFVSGRVVVKSGEGKDRISTTVNFEKQLNINPETENYEWGPTQTKTSLFNKGITREEMELVSTVTSVLSRVFRKLDEHYENKDPEKYRDENEIIEKDVPDISFQES